MATATHVWRATRLNTRRNSTRASVASVLRAEKLRAAALGAAAAGVAPAHDFVGAGAAPRSKRVVAFDDEITVHILPPLCADVAHPDDLLREEGVCPVCHAPVEEERRRWKVALGLGLGLARQVDELDGVRGVCRCESKRYPEYGLEGDEVIVEGEGEDDDDDDEDVERDRRVQTRGRKGNFSFLGLDDDDDDDDDVFANLALASRTLFPKRTNSEVYVEEVVHEEEEEFVEEEPQRSLNDGKRDPFHSAKRPANRYDIYELAADVDDDESTIAPESATAPQQRMQRPQSSAALIPLLSDHEDDDGRARQPVASLLPLPPAVVAPEQDRAPHLQPFSERLAASLRESRRSPTKQEAAASSADAAAAEAAAAAAAASAQRRSRTLPPPCRRPAQRLAGAEPPPPPPARLSSMSESADGTLQSTPEREGGAPMSGGEPALARIAAAALRAHDKHLSQLTPSTGSPGEAAAARARPAAHIDFALPPAAAPVHGLPEPTQPREESGCSARTRSVAGSEIAAPGPEPAQPAQPAQHAQHAQHAQPTRWLPRSSRAAGGSGLSAATAPGDVLVPGEELTPARLRFRGRRARAADYAAERGVPPAVPGARLDDGRGRRRRPAQRERSFAGFNQRDTSVVSATGFEERREEFVAGSRPYLPRVSKTDLGHLGHIAGAQPAAHEKKGRPTQSAAVPPTPPPRSGIAALRGLRGAVSRMMRAKKGASAAQKGEARSDAEGGKPLKEKAQKQLRIVVEKRGDKGGGMLERQRSAGNGGEKGGSARAQKHLRLVVERNPRDKEKAAKIAAAKAGGAKAVENGVGGRAGKTEEAYV